jgi:hypothetical protein
MMADLTQRTTASRTVTDLLAEIDQCHARIADLETEREALRYALADWASEIRPVARKLRGIAHMAELSAKALESDPESPNPEDGERR